MNTNFAAVSATPIAAPLSPAHKQERSTPMPPPPPDRVPAQPLVSAASPALARAPQSAGVFYQASEPPSRATYSVPHATGTAMPPIAAGDVSAISASRSRARAVYGMVTDFAA